MDSRSISNLSRQSAAPRGCHPRLAPFRSMDAFVTDQVLLFWPPYRVEHHCDSCQHGPPPSDQDEP